VDRTLGTGWKRKRLLKKDVVFSLITLLLKQIGRLRVSNLSLLFFSYQNKLDFFKNKKNEKSFKKNNSNY